MALGNHISLKNIFFGWFSILEPEKVHQNLNFPIIIGQILRYFFGKYDCNKENIFCVFTNFNWTNCFFIWFFRILGYFLVGTLFCTLTTELAKYKLGRLRPYFITVCKPDMSDAICKVEGTIKAFWSFEPTLFVHSINF